MPITETRTGTLDEDPSSWRPLIQTAQQWEVRDAQNILDTAGIPSVVQAEQFSGTYFEPFYQKHRLFVPESRLEDAVLRIENSPYEKFLLDYNEDDPLEDVSDWRYRDVLLLLSGFAIGLVDWIVLYFLHLLDFVTGNHRETD